MSILTNTDSKQLLTLFAQSRKERDSTDDRKHANYREIYEQFGKGNWA